MTAGSGPASVAAVLVDDLAIEVLRPTPGALVERLEAGRVRANRLVYVQLAEIALLARGWEPDDEQRRADRRRGRRHTSAESLCRSTVVTDVAFALELTEGAAARRVDAAVALLVDGRLPGTARLAANGALDWRRIDALVGRTRDLTIEQCAAVEARVLVPRVLAETIGRFEDTVDRAVLAVDAEAAERRRVGVRSGRRVVLWKNRGAGDVPDGGASLMVSGPAEALLAAWTAVDAAARWLRGHGDPRTLDQLRHDLVVTGCTRSGLPVPQQVLGSALATARGAADSPTDHPAESPADYSADSGASPAPAADGAPGAASADGAHGPDRAADADPYAADAAAFRAALAAVDARIDVVVPVGTLHGADTPGYLQGYGPIPAQMARDLAEHGVWRCLGVDPAHGTVLGVGRTTYTPGYVAGTNLRTFMAAAAPRCTIGTCNARGVLCDTEHHTPYAHGGATCICNTGPVCRRHHRQKSAGYATIEASTDADHPPGTKILTTRAGRRRVLFPHAPVTPDPHGWPDDCDHLGSDSRSEATASTVQPTSHGDDDPPF